MSYQPVGPASFWRSAPAAASAQAQQLTPAIGTQSTGTVRDLAGAVRDLNSGVVDMSGNTESMQVKETASEIGIELAADVLFDFDKSNIKPEAASALHSVANIITSQRSLSISSCSGFIQPLPGIDCGGSAP